MSSSDIMLASMSANHIRVFVDELTKNKIKIVVIELYMILPSYSDKNDWKNDDKKTIDHTKDIIKKLNEKKIDVVIIMYKSTEEHAKITMDLNKCFDFGDGKEKISLSLIVFDAAIDGMSKISEKYLKHPDYKFSDSDFKQYIINVNDKIATYGNMENIHTCIRLIERLKKVSSREIMYFYEKNAVCNAGNILNNSAYIMQDNDVIYKIHRKYNNKIIHNLTNYTKFNSVLEINVSSNIIVIDNTNRSDEQSIEQLDFAICLQQKCKCAVLIFANKGLENYSDNKNVFCHYTHTITQ